MVENLNYASLQPTDSLDSTSFCYENDPDNCEEDGRLYLWSAVMDSAATWSDNGKGCGYGVVCSPTFPVRGVCPAGWHVPTRDEVIELLDAVGGVDVAGDMLISEYSGCIDEVDLYGFSFRPTGRKRSRNIRIIASTSRTTMTSANALRHFLGICLRRRRVLRRMSI